MVVRARLFCSERRCTAVFEAIGRIEELEALACDCGAGLQIVGWPDPVDDIGGDVELLPLAA